MAKNGPWCGIPCDTLKIASERRCAILVDWGIAKRWDNKAPVWQHESPQMLFIGCRFGRASRMKRNNFLARINFRHTRSCTCRNTQKVAFELELPLFLKLKIDQWWLESMFLDVSCSCIKHVVWNNAGFSRVRPRSGHPKTAIPTTIEPISHEQPSGWGQLSGTQFKKVSTLCFLQNS